MKPQLRRVLSHTGSLRRTKLTKAHPWWSGLRDTPGHRRLAEPSETTDWGGGGGTDPGSGEGPGEEQREAGAP